MKNNEIIINDYRGHGVSLMHHWRIHAYNLRLFPIRKPLNILHSLYEWKTHKTFLKSRPFLIRLNTSAICNLKCPCCRTKESFNLKPGQSREPYLMSLEIFEKVLSQTRSLTQRMSFHITGEPMMNTKLFEMIKMAHKQKIFTYFCTNYNLMTEAHLSQIFESGLDKLRICFDGFSQDAYNKYRVGGNVEKLKQAIAMTMKEKRQRKASRPVVEVQIIRFLHVQPELSQIKQFCDEHGVDRIFSIPDGCNFDGSHKLTVQGKPYTGCFWPWVSMIVDSDGSVYTCGQGFDNMTPFGNVKTDTIDSIWNNELYKETRQFLSGKSNKKEDLNLFCNNCPDGFGYNGPVVMSKGEPYLSQIQKA